MLTSTSQLHLHDSRGRTNWASTVRKLLCSLGFGYVWLSQQIGDVKLFTAQVRDRLVSISTQELNAQCNLYFPAYLDYHPTPFAAPYLSVLPNYDIRRFFALLHCNSLPVKNNLIRLKMVENNICTHCHEIENEYHVLFECHAYDALRHHFIPSKFICRHPSPNKFIELLNSDDSKLIISVAHYFRTALKERF